MWLQYTDYKTPRTTTPFSHLIPSTSLAHPFTMVLSEYSYIFAIGTFFALLDAFNNGASE